MTAAPLAVRKDKAASADKTPRDKLLAAATRLFCKNGINATGIDANVDEAGTAKTTLYKLFGSKSDLVEAVLEAEGRVWRDWFIGGIERGKTPRAKLDLVFPVLKKWFAESDFYGCVFINAVGEHDKDETRLRALTLQHKRFVLSHLEQLASKSGAAKPELLSHQLGALMDGAIVAAMVTHNPSAGDAAAAAASSLLSAACGPKRCGRHPEPRNQDRKGGERRGEAMEPLCFKK